MNTAKSVVWLIITIIALSLIATISPLFVMEKGDFFSFTTLRGGKVMIFGEGIYRFDTVFFASGYKGQDYVTLFFGIPLLSVTLLFYKKRPLKGGLLLLAIIAYFLYVYASMSLGAAYNPLFIIYVLLFSACFFCFIVIFSNLKLEDLPGNIQHGLPRTAPAIYLSICGVVTLVVWLVPLIFSAIHQTPPKILGHYTTMVTDALDLAIITPATFLASWLIFRKKLVGYKIAFPLIGIIIFLLPVIALSTFIQTLNGISYSMGEVIGPISGFLLLGLFGIWAMWSILRKLPDNI